MKTTLTILAAALALCGGRVFAADAPAAPAVKPMNVTTPAKAVRNYYSSAVEKHVRDQSARAGAFMVRDDVLNKDWPLKLVRIHKDRIVDLGDGRFFACADFKEKGGGKTPIDLDFYVAKKDGAWNVEKVLVHKVAGKPRYTYNDKNEMVPIP